MISMRLMRFGTKKKPSYRIVVMNSKTPTKSKALDFLGFYDPLKEPAEIKIDIEKARSWLNKGAQASRTVRSLLDRVSASKRATD